MPLLDVPRAARGPGARAPRRGRPARCTPSRACCCTGAIDHVQAAWPKLDRAVVLDVLRGGADDLGGLLLDGTLDPAAGAEAGRVLAADDVTAIAAELDRPVRQRTTLYDEVPADRVTVGRGRREWAGRRRHRRGGLRGAGPRDPAGPPGLHRLRRARTGGRRRRDVAGQPLSRRLVRRPLPPVLVLVPSGAGLVAGVRARRGDPRLPAPRRGRGGHRAARALRRRDVERPLVRPRGPLGGDDGGGHLVGARARPRGRPPDRAADPRRRGPRGVRRPGHAHVALGRRRARSTGPASASSGPGRRRRRSSRAWRSGRRSSSSSSAPRRGWCRGGTARTRPASAAASPSIRRPPARCGRRFSTTPSAPSTPDAGCARRSTSCGTGPGATCTTRSTTRTCAPAWPPATRSAASASCSPTSCTRRWPADDVVLEDSALVRVDGRTAVAASGARYDLDALVLATGFHAARQPYAPRVHGRRGTLAEHWADGMTAYASTSVHGFPNMFVLDGPNASLGHNSAIYMIETQIEYVLGALDHLARAGEPLEVSAAAEQRLRPRRRRGRAGHRLAARRVPQLVPRRGERAPDAAVAGVRALLPRAQRSLRSRALPVLTVFRRPTRRDPRLRWVANPRARPPPRPDGGAFGDQRPPGGARGHREGRARR